MSFSRPLIEIESLIKKGVITDRVVVQGGNTDYHSDLLEMTPFFEPADLERLYEDAGLVICQAGIGSIMLGLRHNKKVITIARKHSLDEHIDEHQEEILDLFSKLNFVLRWNGNNDLGQVLAKLPDFIPAKYPFDEEKISDAIIDYINVTFK